MSVYELNLQVGNHTIGLHLPTRQLKEFFTEYFMGNITKKTPDLSLEIEVMDHQAPLKTVPDSLFHAKRGSR